MPSGPGAHELDAATQQVTPPPGPAPDPEQPAQGPAADEKEEEEEEEENHDHEHAHGSCTQWWIRVEPWVLLPGTKQQWLTFVVFWAAVLGLVVWFILWAFPRIVDNLFGPALEAIESNLTRVQIGVIVTLAVALLPITLVISKEPFVWVAAAIFDVPAALGMVMAGYIVGMPIPFLITRYWFRKRALRFFHRYKYTNAVLLAVKKAGPFKTTLIIRLGPVPGPLVNYMMALPDHMPFWAYETASVIGVLPGALLGVVFGRNIKGLAAMLQGEKLPAGQVAYNLVSLAAAILLLVGGFIYAKRVLREFEEQAERDAARDTQSTDGEEEQSDGHSEGAALEVVVVQAVPLPLDSLPHEWKHKGQLELTAAAHSSSLTSLTSIKQV